MIDPGPVCVFCTTPVARRTEYLLHKEGGMKFIRYAHCNDPLDTAANLRRKSSKDLLLSVIKR